MTAVERWPSDLLCRYYFTKASSVAPLDSALHFYWGYAATRLFCVNDWAQNGYLSGLITGRYRSFPKGDCGSKTPFLFDQNFVGTMSRARIFFQNPLPLFLSFHRSQIHSMVYSILHFLLSSRVYLVLFQFYLYFSSISVFTTWWSWCKWYYLRKKKKR